MRFQWKPGQHVGIVGPTGAGKTYIAKDLLALRRHAVVLATKSKDKTLDEYHFEKYTSWPADYDARFVLLWKKAKNLGDYQTQRLLIYKALDDIYRHGGWTVYMDDLYYISDTLGLKRAIQMLYTQVRSQEVSLVASMQRPRWVPLEAVSQSTYLMTFHVRDRYDVERIAGGMGVDRKDYQLAMQSLGEYEFLLVQSNGEIIKVMRRS
jgi:ABC-type dipeptide/oligopeptide/nickel transport system ATPase component